MADDVDSERTWEVEGTDHVIEAWSAVRLPFEPKGSLLDYRSALRTALRGLKPTDGMGLVAYYGAPSDAFADVENVLLYNIGAGSYSHLTTEGLTLSRGRSPDTRHNLRYEVGPLTYPGPQSETLATVSAQIERVPRSAGEWWALLRPRTEGISRGHDGEFGVDVELSGTWTGPALSAVVKPLLDGLISGLHVHDGTHQKIVTERLAALGDPQALWTQLIDADAAVLGQARTLVRPHSINLAWRIPPTIFAPQFALHAEAATTGRSAQRSSPGRASRPQ